ncbi:MAG: S41 family peptidase [Firmicutes bacterium]|nr:S41 family peptidase [Bacillota bacterium]
MSEDSNNGKGRLIIRKRSLILVLVLAIVAGAVCGAVSYNIYVTRNDFTLVKTEDFEIINGVYSKYAKLEMLYNYLNEKYYKEIDQEDMMTAIYKGLFASPGDPYTTYLTPEEYEDLMISATGDFCGVGVTISSVNNEIVVVSTMDGSPAQLAGIKTGDVIVSVDGVPYSGAEFGEAASAMRGQLNTRVTVSYRRDGVITDCKLIRKKITTKSVYAEMLEDNIGYIRITSFELATAEDFEKELRNMEVRGANGIVIDLRNNGGGIVESGVKIADMLLPEGTIVYLEDRKGERIYENSDAECTSVPYVLLVNGGTASTSEILAAAVKDNDGGKIVGTNTFGKGIVQSIEKLSDDSGALRITVQQYFSPDGNVIHEKGVAPDYEVELTEGSTTDVQLEKAIELLQ